MSKFSSLSIFNSGFSSGCSEYNSRRAYVGLTKKKILFMFLVMVKHVNYHNTVAHSCAF